MKTIQLFVSCLALSLIASGSDVATTGTHSRVRQHAFLMQSDLDELQNTVGVGGPEPVDEIKKGIPEGGVNPFEQRKDVEWSEHSNVPSWLQYVLVFMWVFMLASIPFIIPLADSRPITNTHKFLGATMLVVLFGGFWLFTNIILFQSGHFKTIRPLTNVECIYFMAQVITTVGYGDVTPAKIRGQVFVGMYVLGALFVIAMLVTEMTNVIVTRAKAHFQTFQDDEAVDTDLCTLVYQKRPSPKPLLISLAVFATLDMVWVMFFSMHPGEGKSLFQAVYMSVITLSTVGFGYFTPVTEMGMIFGAFMMFFGAGSLAAVISNFTSFMVQMNQWERLHNPDSKTEAATLLKGQLNGREEITELQFMRFILLQSQAASAPQLNQIAAAFESLKPQEGKVSLKTVEDILSSPVDTPKEAK